LIQEHTFQPRDLVAGHLALDIAGTGRADASSMRVAIELAVRLAGRRLGGQR